jgi:hypothetical protein
MMVQSDGFAGAQLVAKAQNILNLFSQTIRFGINTKKEVSEWLII